MQRFKSGIGSIVSEWKIKVRKMPANGIISGDKKLSRCRAGNTPGLYTRDGSAALTNNNSHYLRRNFIDLAGKRFGRWRVMEYEGRSRWHCICDCGNEKLVLLENLRNGSTGSCGCLKRELRASQFGSTHPGWNPLLTEEDRVKQRKIVGLADWREAVFARDGFTCQICGARGGKLHAHHVNAYHWDIAGRLDVDNGITLCVEDHRGYHSAFGKNNSTKEKFEEFKALKIAKHGAKLREKESEAS